MILSGNGIDHALLMLAGYTAGVPVAPISVAYSLQCRDHAKLRHIAALLRPGLVYVADTAPFEPALAALDLAAASSSSRAATAPPRPRHVVRPSSPRTSAGPAVERRGASTRRRTRSRRSSSPRARPARRRASSTRSGMLCRQPAGDRAALAVPRRASRRWSSTGCRGATPSAATTTSTWCSPRRHALHRRRQARARPDRRRPSRTCARSRRPSTSTCRAASTCSLPHLEGTPRCAQRSSASSTSSSTPPPRCRSDLWERLEAVALPRRAASACRWSRRGAPPRRRRSRRRCTSASTRAGVIGLPAPGVELKLAPDGGQARDPRARAQRHARLLASAGGSRRGRVRRGRLLPHGRRRCGSPTGRPAEGRRLRRAHRRELQAHVRHLGPCRRAARRACSPRARRSCRTPSSPAHDRDASRCSPGSTSPAAGRWSATAAVGLAELARHPAVRDTSRSRCAQWNAATPARPSASPRALLLTEPPSIDAGEITDKGYINQRPRSSAARRKSRACSPRGAGWRGDCHRSLSGAARSAGHAPPKT